MSSNQTSMVDPAIFEHLQAKIDEDAVIREQLRTIIQELEKHGRVSQSILARAHSVPSSKTQMILEDAKKSIQQQAQTIAKLSKVASEYPYYKYNGIWTQHVQNTVFAIVLCGWLGGPLNPLETTAPGQIGRLLTIEEVGGILDVPVNLKDHDAFHLTIEEYLQALISVIEELARLAVNSVTLGDYERPLLISQFIKDIHSGFQILNLKNDSLRRRSDSIKYSLKKVEDVVYDLSLRNLIPRKA